MELSIINWMSLQGEVKCYLYILGKPNMINVCALLEEKVIIS